MSNTNTTKEEILAQLNWRYAVKQYDRTRKIPDKDWETLEEALTLAPSSFGLQPYKFIVITDEATREKLKPAAYGQTPITDASHLLVTAMLRMTGSHPCKRCACPGKNWCSEYEAHI